MCSIAYCRRAAMPCLKWVDAHGPVSWSQADDRWLGLWERRVACDGIYATARGSMVAFVLDGAMEIDPSGSSTSLASGEALLIRGTTPFRYRMEAGTRLLVTQVSASSGPETGLVRVRASEVPRSAARAF